MSDGMTYIDYRPTDDYFALRVQDDRMKNAGICKGDLIICHKQAEANAGDIIVAYLRGKQIIARYNEQGAHVLLTFDDAAAQPEIVDDGDEFIILGKAVEARHFFE